jgi:molybdopterin-guanine dinucleotide biosynthesis protein A
MWGLRMLDRVAQQLAATASEILIAGGPFRRAPECGVPVTFVTEVEDSSGPLVGIFSAMLEAKCDASVVVGCDMPFVDPSLVWFMLESSAGTDATVADVGGVLQPLLAVYRKSALGAMRGLLREGITSPKRLLAVVRTNVIPEETIRAYDPDLRSCFSVDTAEDLEEARAWIRGEWGAPNWSRVL